MFGCFNILVAVTIPSALIVAARSIPRHYAEMSIFIIDSMTSIEPPRFVAVKRLSWPIYIEIGMER